MAENNVFTFFFVTVVTKKNTDSLLTARCSLVNNDIEVLNDICFTKEAVRIKKLDSLRDDKSGGPDNLPSRLLKIEEEICIPLTIIFQSSFNEGNSFSYI